MILINDQLLNHRQSTIINNNNISYLRLKKLYGEIMPYFQNKNVKLYYEDVGQGECEIS